MAQILVRNLDDALVERLKARARQNHRSLQGEVRAILEREALRATTEEVRATGEKWRAYWQRKGKTFSDSGTRLPNSERMPSAKAISVAAGIAQPCMSMALP